MIEIILTYIFGLCTHTFCLLNHSYTFISCIGYFYVWEYFRFYQFSVYYSFITETLMFPLTPLYLTELCVHFGFWIRFLIISVFHLYPNLLHLSPAKPTPQSMVPTSSYFSAWRHLRACLLDCIISHLFSFSLFLFLLLSLRQLLRVHVVRTSKSHLNPQFSTKPQHQNHQTTTHPQYSWCSTCLIRVPNHKTHRSPSTVDAMFAHTWWKTKNFQI